MILLHLLWTGGVEGETEPALFLFGEETIRQAESDRAEPSPRVSAATKGSSRTIPGAPSPRELPFLVPPRELRSRLRSVADGLLYECAEVGTCEILWPTEGGTPLTSRGEDRSAGGTLAIWQVAGLLVPPEDVIPLLAALPREAPSSVAYTASVRYWVEVTAFCLGLLARQRFLPGISTQGNGGERIHSAQWLPVLTEEEDRTVLEVLTAAIPRVCLAEVSPRRGRQEDLDLRLPGPVLRGFVVTVLDATLRRLLAEEGFPECTFRKGPFLRGPGGPLGSWLKALGWIDGRIEGEPRILDQFAREVRQWSDLLSEPAPGSFRTALRLIPPATDAEAEEDPAIEPHWTIEFFLQDRADPTLLLPAAKVWEEGGSELVWAGQTITRPQDRLLEDLGRASHVFPALERSLETAAPTSGSLSLDEAHTFLSQAGPLLEESGFGVLYPDWWREEGSRPRLRLRLRPAEATAQESGPSEPAPPEPPASPAPPARPLPVSLDAGIDAKALIPAGIGTGGLIDYNWEIALGEATLTPTEFHHLVSLKRPLVRLRGQWFELPPDRTQSIQTMLKECARKKGLTLSEAVHWGMGGLALRLGLPGLDVQAEGWVGTFLETVRGDLAPQPIRMGPEFAGTLRPYQERGVGWLDFMRLCGLGACLADDMGLGKTIQLIALLLHERKEGREVGPTLVLCPMSVVGNWQREVRRFAPSLRVLIHHGLRRLRDGGFLAQAQAQDVIISTYALAHRDRLQLRQVAWERVVLDEAQNIKNPSTFQAHAVRSLGARTRVALTGTPLENRLLELWSILDVLNPSYLGSRAEFRRSFAVPIERYRAPRPKAALRRLVQPFLLRRLKTDPQVIRDLPEKLEMRVFCNLTREQATLYQAVVNEMLGAIEGSEGMTRRGLILSALTRLKQVCNHPVHYLQDGSAIEGRSGKVARLTEMLEEILAEGDRALVFTQFTEMGNLLQGFLAEQLRADVLFLHGGTPQLGRDRMVDRFQEPGGPPIFILSLRAGGAGLNLTAANHVFHFDRWWNPAVEDQATDRAFRIGQTRNVQVHKFVCVGTLEEKIDAMLMEKRDLASSIVGAGEQWLTELDLTQLREVLALSIDAVSEG